MAIVGAAKVRHFTIAEINEQNNTEKAPILPVVYSNNNICKQLIENKIIDENGTVLEQKTGKANTLK